MSVLWVNFVCIVSLFSVYCECIVSLLWVYCECIVSVLWAYCERIVSVLWVYCECIVSVKDQLTAGTLPPTLLSAWWSPESATSSQRVVTITPTTSRYTTACMTCGVWTAAWLLWTIINLDIYDVRINCLTNWWYSTVEPQYQRARAWRKTAVLDNGGKGNHI